MSRVCCTVPVASARRVRASAAEPCSAVAFCECATSHQRPPREQESESKRERENEKNEKEWERMRENERERERVRGRKREKKERGGEKIMITHKGHISMQLQARYGFAREVFFYSIFHDTCWIQTKDVHTRRKTFDDSQ